MYDAFSNISAHFYVSLVSQESFHRLKCSALSSVQEPETDLPSYAGIRKHYFTYFSNGINSNMHCHNLDFLSFVVILISLYSAMGTKLCHS